MEHPFLQLPDDSAPIHEWRAFRYALRYYEPHHPAIAEAFRIAEQKIARKMAEQRTMVVNDNYQELPVTRPQLVATPQL